MKKQLTIIFLFLILLSILLFGCGRKQSVQTSNQKEISTPIDGEITGLDTENNDLNESDLNDVGNDLQSIEDL